MSTDTLILSSLCESLSDGQQSTWPSETSALFQRLNRVLTLHSDFNKFGVIKRLFGLHDFKPSFYSLFNISNGFFI